MGKYILFLLLYLGLMWAGCQTSAESKPALAGPDAFMPLLGVWENTADSGLYESWERVGEESYAGMGYLLTGEDTTLIERLSLEFRPEGVFYIAEVAHNPGPIAFKLVQMDEAWVFENPTHDFPQRIAYRFLSPNALKVRIGAISEENNKQQEFSFSRIQE